MRRGRYGEAVLIRFSKEQRAFIENMAAKKSRELGITITKSSIVRALINREIDIQSEEEKVWDEEL